ncbi:hypothetical protein PG999_004577 [Apiospora kogelbergensis]|uniref:Uncharacterized protein n=1 Tax=Apiospora kogelbergensis TaxID=1337665 RepID=A0AAW0QZQ0_9PEZI
MPLFSLNSPSNRPEVDIEGSMTNPRDKRCRKSLRPWHDFHEEQEPGTLYDTFPTESRVFEDRNFPAGLGNRTRREDPRCDVQCLTPAQPRNIGAKHSKVQDELDAAEQELQRAAARIRRYRKQKKL